MIWTALIKQHDVVWKQQAILKNLVILKQQRLSKTQAKYKKTWKHVVQEQQAHLSWNMSNISWIILYAHTKTRSQDLYNYYKKY